MLKTVRYVGRSLLQRLFPRSHHRPFRCLAYWLAAVVPLESTLRAIGRWIDSPTAIVKCSLSRPLGPLNSRYGIRHSAGMVE